MRLVVLSDGRRGIENQALGLAEAISRLSITPCIIDKQVIENGRIFSALPPRLQYAIRRNWTGRIDATRDADMVIGCGRQAIAPLLTIKRRPSAPFTVYIQDPRIDPGHFDCVVAPAHDGLSGPHVEPMIGSPNRITKDRLEADVSNHKARLAALHGPRAMIAMGGPSRTRRMNALIVRDHFAAAKSLLDAGYSLLVTTSRRTPKAVRAGWRDFAATSPDIWLHDPESNDPNPYFAFLGAADIILVTEDSTNMLTESCATGTPTARLRMGGKAGKFSQLYRALKDRCHLEVFDGPQDLKAYTPLNETERIARRLLDRLSRK